MTAFTDAALMWNRRFEAEGFLFGTEPNEWLREQASALPAGGRVLCLADGEGRNSVWLARRGHAVDAFDISDVAVAKARRFAQSQGVRVDLAVADSDRLAWPAACYDGVVAIFVQYADPAQRARLFARIVRCLKPGGVLILQGYTPGQLAYRSGGPGRVEHLYTEALLRDAFAALELVEVRSYEAELAEGSAHHGMAALIGLVARKPGGPARPG